MKKILKHTAFIVFSIVISACGEKENKNLYRNDNQIPKSPPTKPTSPTQSENESILYENKLKKTLKKYNDKYDEDYKEYKFQLNLIQKELDDCQAKLNCKEANDKSNKFLSFLDRDVKESIGYWMPADLAEFTNNSVGIIEIKNSNLIICHIDNIFSKNYYVSFISKSIITSDLSIKDIEYTPGFKKYLDTMKFAYSKYSGSFTKHTFKRINKELYDVLKEKTNCK